MNFNIIEIAVPGVAEVNRHSVRQKEKEEHEEGTGATRLFTMERKNRKRKLQIRFDLQIICK